MNITVPIHELVSWLITIVAVTLFIVERKKNVATPSYMALQGILRACDEKNGHYAALASRVQENDKREEIPKSEHLLVLETVQSEYVAMMQNIMGTMKAIQPTIDMSFDAEQFTKKKEHRG